SFFGIRLSKTKKVVLRIGPVLTPNSGMFAELFPLVKMGLGGKVGKGTQMMSWIHEFDLIQMVIWIMELSSPAAIYHACSPHPVRNIEFMKTFRNVARISFGLSLPTPVAYLGAL